MYPWILFIKMYRVLVCLFPVLQSTLYAGPLRRSFVKWTLSFVINVDTLGPLGQMGQLAAIAGRPAALQHSPADVVPATGTVEVVTELGLAKVPAKIVLKEPWNRAINQHPRLSTGYVPWLMALGSCLDSSDKRATDAACPAHFLICRIIHHK